MQYKLVRSSRYLHVACLKHQPETNTIFQLKNSKKVISLNDVKKAFEKTKDLSHSKKLQYFYSKGIHFARARRYINIVERFNDAFDKDEIVEIEIYYNDTNDTNDTNDILDENQHKVKYESKQIFKRLYDIKDVYNHIYAILYIFVLFIILEIVGFLLESGGTSNT